MSNINSSADHLTLNADGVGKDVKFNCNGVEKASIDSSGNFTSTSIDATKLSGTVPNFTSTGIDDNATSTAITIDASGAVGIQNTAPNNAGSIKASYEAGNVSTSPGGVFYKFFSVTDGTPVTFFTTNGVGEWAGIVEASVVSSIDVNRAGYLLARHAYNEAFTTMVTSSQNVAIAFTMSGNNMQISCTGGGAIYRVQMRVMGSEES